MAEPAVENGGESDDGVPEDVGGDEVVDEDEDVEMVQTDIEETGTDPDGFFDGVETDTGGDDASDVGAIFDGVEEGEDESHETPEAADTRSTGLASDINSGVARAAVIGLDDEWETASGQTRTRDDLETEFRETFEAFRLGHYGAICAEEYLLQDAEDIHPVWGLVGASLICAAVIVYKRPDGDQVLESAKMKLGSTDLSKITDSLPGKDDLTDDED
jgi:hypothetical protein